MSALAYSTRDAAQIAGVSYRALLTAMNAGDLAYFVPSGCKRKRYVRDLVEHHAVTISWGLLPRLRSDAMRGDVVAVEEWSAQLVENHAMEALEAASTALGRPVCVRGLCHG